MFQLHKSFISIVMFVFLLSTLDYVVLGQVQPCKVLCPQITVKILKSNPVAPIIPIPPSLDDLFCNSRRFGLSNLYSESQLELKTGVYGQSKNYLSVTQNLGYEFIAPANDTMSKRPFILMVHEGAFLFGELGAEMGKARLMAQKGYATAAINYRLGFDGASQNNPCGGNTSGVIKALYRAVQDTKSALNYFVANSANFGIDPEQIFLAGSSSGSMTVTALNYMTESDFESLVPGISQELGPLDSKPTSLNYKIRGLLTYLGSAIINENLITTTNVKPMLMFQGAEDNILPYNSGTLYNCVGYITTYGSLPTALRLKMLNQPFEWIVQQGSGHITNYSLDYISERYADFIKRVWCNDSRQISRLNTTIVENIPLK